jgi:hypothetical protein
LQAIGQEFESPQLHQLSNEERKMEKAERRFVLYSAF